MLNNLLNLHPGDLKKDDITHVTNKILSLRKIYPGNLDGTLDFEKPYQLRKRILGKTRPQHMNMVGLQI